MREASYEFFEHTADIGLRGHGKDLGELFLHMAEGMFDLIAVKKPRQAETKPQKKEHTLLVKAGNREELLVSWLSELLSLADIHKVIFTTFIIDKINDTEIKARAGGVPLHSGNFIRQTEIKAVTYHQLKIEGKAEFLTAEVIFDV